MFAKNSFYYKKLVNIFPDMIEFQNWVSIQGWVKKNSWEVLGIIPAMVMSNLKLDLKRD